MGIARVEDRGCTCEALINVPPASHLIYMASPHQMRTRRPKPEPESLEEDGG